MNQKTHINFAALEAQLILLAEKFSSAKPFEHVIFDDFLHTKSLDQLQAAIAKPIEKNRSNDYLFAKNKFENPAFGDAGGIMAEVKVELLSQRFSDCLSYIFGKTLFVDPTFLGGGLHQGGEGSFLDMHADFSRHPVHHDWLREINILLYLNRDYREEFGGHLELKHAHSGLYDRVSPVENRLVLMMTKEFTLHGYKPINFPEGTYRTSLAAYAYSLDSDYSSVPLRTTLWKPHDASLGKSVAARLSPVLVKLKNALFGSRTARRAGSSKSQVSQDPDRP
jgi:hypothetical protein